VFNLGSSSKKVLDVNKTAALKKKKKTSVVVSKKNKAKDKPNVAAYKSGPILITNAI
jgi:hypothetical protein